MLTSDFKHPSLLRGDPYEPGERWSVMDARSASCKCLGERIYICPCCLFKGCGAISGAAWKCAFPCYQLALQTLR